MTNKDLEIVGPKGARRVGQGLRQNYAGWVVYREGAQNMSDPVFDTKAAAVKAAKLAVGLTTEGV